ncbi:long-chain acyl-CoA synthetase [Breznakibacter xylanolyticus]|uniref:Long-chain acyl-CoA synthetase n=1 Tax=Breznakibacter xylanolyticus TaxID=990 RepID=A0A2W7NP31_9BACT|nr:AMP-binding protein [Breznakibacter xylanolyticus]PZX15006.1 long-chain acyl-CoA synthetase [Breznakibacter xylanolyticus]
MKSIITFFEESVARYGENPFLWEKKNGVFHSLTYAQVHAQVEEMAAGFLSAGLEVGDRVALLSEGCPMWLISELAVLFCGAINVPLSTKLEGDSELVFRINHSGSRFVVVSSTQLPKIRMVKGQLTGVEKIFVIQAPDKLEENEHLLSDLQQRGAVDAAFNPDALAQRKQGVTGNTVANITYTSGTTADPKGIMLTHRNYTANVEQAFSYIDIPQHYITLAVLPWDHAFAHTACLYAFMNAGAGVASVEVGRTPMETLKNFSNNLLEIRPHVLMSVPAIAKNFKKNIEKGIQSKGKLSWWLFRAGLAVAIWYNGQGYDKGRGLKAMAKPLMTFFDRLIFSKIKVKFGGQLQYFIGGGALLDIDLQRFFYAIGVPMYQGYGLSEAAPIISANTPTYHKLGSSGRVVNDLEIKICDEKGLELPVGEKGEIVIRGENVMAGYWKNDDATASAIRNGWLHTGDMGYLQPDGYLYVLGRFKSLLISADGEKYSPEGIEEAMVDHCSFIDQAMLHNNQNPYTVGLWVPSRENVNAWMRTHKKQVDNDDHLRDVLREMLDQINQFKTGGKHGQMFPQRWVATASAVLPEAFTEENKLLNTTMKVVRAKVEAHFADEIAYLYTPAGKEFVNDRNVMNLRRFLGK